jgi:hypothetical protein
MYVLRNNKTNSKTEIAETLKSRHKFYNFLKMKKIVLTLSLAFVALTAFSQTTTTSGYYKPSTGTYVQPYTKTSSNSTNTDNYSTKGNSNPYTGQSGTRAADYTPAASNYGQNQNIQTGSRGGQYYINSNGNKTYVPKTKN